MDRWDIYEVLKNNKDIKIKEIEETNSQEVKEGVIEFLLMKNHTSLKIQRSGQIVTTQK
ncbi:hypothetical protein [Clostridium novyi]|uniref:Uncharacterized protein n=1 Tax=Clostridium novyi B str. ATCC 27606 TaxID=1443123 RepID=A0AA40IRI6_CLONO|nr:hypothetical protein [Clostridium novyi]KEI11468.1 hypothetical protein Z959_p0031 [Clostridium novyi B str. ATCC 27606]